MDRVRSNGTYFFGRTEVETSYVDTLGGVDRNATLKEYSSKLRFLTADIALLEINLVITGASNGPTLKEHGTFVYVKRNSEWMLAAIRATRIQ